MQTSPQSAAFMPYSFARLGIWLLLLAALRIVSLLLVDLNLFGDEAQYWHWAKELDFGYYSKPPMLSWAIALTTGLFGDAEWALRLPTLLFHTGTAIAVYLLGCRLFDQKIAFWAAILFATLPAVWLSSLLASTDPPLLCFWAFALFFLHRAGSDNRLQDWILFGLFTGLGMLSKFATIYLLLGLVLWMLVDKDARRSLAMPRIGLAMLVAFIVFLPNLLWNAAHDFVSWVHLGENANLGGKLFRPEKALEFQASQLGVFGPVIYPFLIYLLFTAKKRWQDPAFRFLFCFIAPAMAIIGFQGLLSRANANWQAPVFVAASLMIAAAWIRAEKPSWLKTSIGVHSGFGILLVVLGTLSAHFSWPLPTKDPFARMKGWQDMGQQVEAFAAAHPDRPLLFTHRMTLAEMLYYAPDVAQPILKWNDDPYINDQYELTRPLTGRAGENLLLITRDPDPQDVLGRFTSATSLGVIDIQTDENRRLWYEIWAVDGFQGYVFEEEQQRETP